MNLKISQRLYLAVGMALVLPALVLVATFVLDAQGRAQFDSALAKAKERREVAGAMRDTVFRQGLQARNIGLRSDVDEMKKEVDGLRALKDVYKKNLARFTQLEPTVEEAADLSKAAKLEQDTVEPLQKAEEFASNFRPDTAATILVTKVSPLQDQWIEVISHLVAIQDGNVAAALSSNEAQHSNLVRVAAVAAYVAVVNAVESLLMLLMLLYVVVSRRGVACIGAIPTAWCCVALVEFVDDALRYGLARGIVLPLHDAIGLARRVAAGDLTARINGQRTDEVGQLLSSLGEMQSSLERVVTNVRSGSENVATASAEIAQGNDDLSARTESQASALEQTAVLRSAPSSSCH